MPPIENFADTGPVGVLNPCCKTRTGRIRAAGALARPRCRPSLTPSRKRKNDQAPRPHPHPGARTRRAGSPLRARTSRRTDPHRYRCACRDLGLTHIRTKPYTPKTNGKAERFIQTALREWAYAQAYPTSDHRAAALPIWLHRCNWHRPHSSLKSKAPISRLALAEDNLLRLHT